MTGRHPVPDTGADSKDRPKSMLPPIIAAAVLVALGIGIGLWAWVGGRGDGPDYRADCATIEREAPEFPDLVGLTAPTITSEVKIAAVRRSADQWQSIADQLRHDQASELFAQIADASLDAADGLERRDLSTVTGGIRELSDLVGQLAAFLDEHCERWIGPGQWGEPGAAPTGITDLPIELPSEPQSDLSPDPRAPTTADSSQVESGTSTPSPRAPRGFGCSGLTKEDVRRLFHLGSKVHRDVSDEGRACTFRSENWSLSLSETWGSSQVLGSPAQATADMMLPGDDLTRIGGYTIGRSDGFFRLGRVMDIGPWRRSMFMILYDLRYYEGFGGGRPPPLARVNSIMVATAERAFFGRVE